VSRGSGSRSLKRQSIIENDMVEAAKPSPHHWAMRTFVEKDYENMRNNGMTAGLDGLTRVDGQKNDLNYDSLLKTYELFKRIIPKWFWDECYRPGVGNPEGMEYEGRLLTFSDMTCLLNAWRLYDYGIEHKKIVEIGGGFGCLADQLLTLWDSEYYLVDLEDSLKLQKYYLGITQPDREITYLTPDEPFPECDLVINIRSFMEMTNAQIEYYFNQINKKSKYLYCANRYEKGPAILKQYPFGNDWEILLAEPLPGQPYIQEFYLRNGKGNFNKMLSILPPWST